MPQTSSTDIAQQAKQLGLAVATITPVDVANCLTDILSLETIEARQIFPYRFDAATQTVFVAVTDAAELKKPAPPELQAQRKLNRKLTLQLIDPTVFESLLPAIRSQFEKRSTGQAPSVQPNLSSKQTLPTIDLRTVSIPRSVLLKIPHDVATKFRVLVFDAPSGGNRVKLASDQPQDTGVQRVVAVIREKRGVTAELYEAEPEPMNAVLAAYTSSADPISLMPIPVAKTVPIVAPADATQMKPTQVPIDQVVKVQLPVIKPKPSQLPQTNQVSIPSFVPPPRPAQPVSLPTTTESTKPIVMNPAKPEPVKQPASSETMPVDSSPITRQLPQTAVPKIQLASRLAQNPTTNSFPLPIISPAAQAFATSALPSAASAVPATSMPPKIATVQPLVANPIPAVVGQASAASNLAMPAIAPLNKPGTQSLSDQPSAQVQQSQITNTSSFASLNVIQSTDDQNLDTTVGSTIKSAQELETVVRTGLVPKILAAILQYAVNVAASDIHVEATVDSLRIRFRVDGVLQDVLQAPIGLDAPFVSRVKILSGMKIDEQRIPQDGRFSATSGGREIDFRVSTLPAIHGEKVVMRILDKSVGVRSIDQLGMEGTNLDRVKAAIIKPFGIILVTGPTGSGKTTTLYAMLGTLNKPGVNIITLEDPVEYELIGITQTQVKPKIGFSFAEGLRSVLRQDPDIVMVGEIRDRETASLATHAALTGHLVLSTLHTNNAAGAIPRFLNMGVEPFLVASSIDAVIAQRLIRRLCDKCRQPATLSEAIQKDIGATLTSSVVESVKKAAAGPFQFFAPHGCAECHDGYRGRLGIYEVMTITPEIEALTAKKATITEVQTTAEAQGMITMKQDGILKAMTGLTSLDEVLRVTTSD